MVQKCLLTGALLAIMPGSPVQLLVALLVISAYLLLILKAGPYKGDLEDSLAFLTSLCLFLSIVLGFAIITDNHDNQVFDMTIMGIVLVAINVTPFLFLMFAVFKIVKNGSNVGVINGGYDSNNLTRVHPTGSRMKSQISLHQMKTVVIKDKVTKLQQSHAEYRKAAIDKIEQREKLADARVRQRLIERRRLKAESSGGKSGSKNKGGGVAMTAEDVGPRKRLLVMVEKVRLKINEKIQTVQRLRSVFAKLDVDSNCMMSKGEFERLVSAILKKKSIDQKVLGLLWDAAWEQRKHGKEDELDAATLGHWLRLDGST